MKKSSPKMILNLSLENDEFENKIAIAMEEYAKDVIYEKLDDMIVRIVERRVNALIGPGYSWTDDKKIKGIPFDKYVKNKTEELIADVIDKNIKEIFAKKVVEML